MNIEVLLHECLLSSIFFWCPVALFSGFVESEREDSNLRKKGENSSAALLFFSNSPTNFQVWLLGDKRRKEERERRGEEGVDSTGKRKRREEALWAEREREMCSFVKLRSPLWKEEERKRGTKDAAEFSASCIVDRKRGEKKVEDLVGRRERILLQHV